MRDALEIPLDRERVRATVDGLLAEGRPVYFSTQLHYEAGFPPHLRGLLEEAYALEPVARLGRVEAFRLRKRDAVQ